MITCLKMLSVLMASSILNMNNPVKMGMAVMMSGGLILLISSKIFGEIWMTTIMFLLFMGGIMVVFMVISSLAPNENPKKISMFFFLPAVLIALMLMWSATDSEPNSVPAQIKTVMMSSWFLVGMIFLMTMYFFLFLLILSKSKTSLRTFL